jgi:DNA-binding IclR family transcriptional regulator
MSDGRPLVPAVNRAVDVLDLLAGTSGPLGVSAIARALELPKSSVANLCAALSHTGMVRAKGGGFVLGPHLARLGAAYLTGVDAVQLFHEACATSGTGGRETAQLAELGDGLDVVYLARRDGVEAVRLASASGHALPATCTATGKAMLATLAPDDLRARLAHVARLPRLTGRSITSRAALHRELDRVRTDGIAYDREEVIEGVVCVGAAVPAAADGDPPLAVSFTLLAPRADPRTLDRVGTQVLAIARAIADSLGRSAPPVVAG